MLVKIIRKIFWVLTRQKSGFAKKLFTLSRLYFEAYTDYSYGIEKNGEGRLLSRLSELNFKVIFDVGAHTGDWSKAVLKRFPDARIHAFEPANDNFLELDKNLDAANVTKNKSALTDKSGQGYLFKYGAKSPLNTLVTNFSFHKNGSDTQSESVVTLRGEQYCEQNRINSIDFLKIDVEGGEHLVLSGFESLLKNQKIRCIQFEYGYANVYTRFLFNDYLNYFSNFGYKVGKIGSKGVIFEDINYKYNNFESGPNFLAVLTTDRELANIITVK